MYFWVIDTIAPTVTFRASTTSWTKNNVTLTGTLKDIGTGVNGYEFYNTAVGAKGYKSFERNHEDTVTYTQTVSTEGTTRWCFRAKDKQGNSTTSSVVTVNIDKTAPTTKLSSSATTTSWSTSPITLTGTATDTYSGVTGYVFSKSSTIPTTWNGMSNGNTKTTTISEKGSNTWYFIVKDLVGNVTTKSVAVKYDPDKPGKPVITSANGAKSGEYVRAPYDTLVISAEASASGITKYQYKINSDETWIDLAVGNNLNINETCTVYIRAIGGNGLISDETSHQVKIDTISPENIGKLLMRYESNGEVGSREYISGTATNENIWTSANSEEAVDNESGVKGTEYTIYKEGIKVINRVMPDS